MKEQANKEYCERRVISSKKLLKLIMLYSLELEIFPEQETCDWMKNSGLKGSSDIVSD
jgi:hypothetical protein